MVGRIVRAAVVVAAQPLPDNPRMREITRSALVALPPAELYALITDIERYPEFVPGCALARIESRGEREVVATLGVRRGGLVTEFTTRNTLDPDRTVAMRLERGPFKSLEGLWSLRPVGESGCEVTLRLRFEFANRFTGMMFAPVFEQTAASLVDAFVVRARQIKARAADGGDAGYAGPFGRSDGRDDDDRGDASGADGGDGGGD
jgi:ribosome-associated toxin RatA of RatAB toxin-antitoxin module